MSNELAHLLREAAHELSRPRAPYARHLRERLEAAAASLEAQEPALAKWMSAALDDPNVCKEMKADIRAWFDSGCCPPTSAVPDGWKLVPVEPTPEMVDRGAEEVDWYNHNARDCYGAMLAAAPQQGGGEDE